MFFYKINKFLQYWEFAVSPLLAFIHPPFERGDGKGGSSAEVEINDPWC
jgi:hypothetical protein